MRIDGLDHANLRCRPQDLPAALAFYRDLLGLKEGPRPAFDFPGHWLYAGGRPILHLAARETVGPPEGPSKGASFEHVAFRARGLHDIRARLAERGIGFAEALLPGFPLHQLFLTDPFGLRVELTFDMNDPANLA
ncbi:VOC family protein [Roseomonas sp. PWR1]|uniref:VOC family protein n=1 Tax=Roseomonas nitratireducens TaxID=2820810 RepID=A0ABS4AX36_9PROT|nr:VOC family protein [Neoroseomonas nitratireducens]MBP0465932.1 VOC family protein [Neoroseomonas nitratireducens]